MASDIWQVDNMEGGWHMVPIKHWFQDPLLVLEIWGCSGLYIESYSICTQHTLCILHPIIIHNSYKALLCKCSSSSLLMDKRERSIQIQHIDIFSFDFILGHCQSEVGWSSICRICKYRKDQLCYVLLTWEQWKTMHTEIANLLCWRCDYCVTQ